MQAGKMKRTAHIAYQAFSKAVTMNLHVFVLWDLDGVTGSLFPTYKGGSGSVGRVGDTGDHLEHEAYFRALFQSMYQRCAHVDHYQPWSKHAYSEIALQWWQRGKLCVMCRRIIIHCTFYVDSSAIKWQDWTETSSQLEAISSLAAHIHIVTLEALVKTYGELGRHMVTPKLFLDCLTMTQDIAKSIKENEMVQIFMCTIIIIVDVFR